MAVFSTAEELISAFLADNPKNEKIGLSQYLIKVMEWSGVAFDVHSRDILVSKLVVGDGKAKVEINEKFYNYISWRNVSFAYAISAFNLAKGDSITVKESMVSEEPYETSFDGINDEMTDFAIQLLLPTRRVQEFNRRVKTEGLSDQEIAGEVSDFFAIARAFVDSHIGKIKEIAIKPLEVDA